MKLNIIITGNPVDGHRFIGPLTDDELNDELDAGGVTDRLGGDWWVAELISITEWEEA